MNEIIRTASSFVILFFVFSILGWCTEVILKFFQYHRFINRGFLIGPYCPIYGSGAVFVTLTVGAFSQMDNSYGATFLISMIVCGVLEYFVSYYMEKKFHARWWDYSQKPMNLNGRVWIGNLILFGIGGTVIVKIIDPFFFHTVARIPEKVMCAMAVCIGIIMLSDNVVSHFVMKFVKASVENSDADNTEAIGKEIKHLLSDKSVLHKRIADAYPNVVYKTEKIAKKMQDVKDEVEHLRAEVERMKEETTSEIKNDIIQKQENLISLMEAQEESNAQEIARIRSEIKNKKIQLENKLKHMK